MKISILYFDGCPNHPPVVEMARRVVAEHGLDAEVEQVEVGPEDVERLRFLGSPTVQVDGVDIEPTARERTDYAMSCRVYDTEDGLPQESLLLAAIGVDGPSAGGRRSGDRAGFVAIGGSFATGALSSACCGLPLLLLSVGASAAGASAFFERWRPVFIAVAVTGVALGFYFAYSRNTACPEGCCDATPRRGRRLQRASAWVAAVFVVGFILIPYYSPTLIRTFATPSAQERTTSHATGITHDAEPVSRSYEIDGMTCDACAATLEVTLANVPGVIDAKVSYTEKTATVTTRPGDPDEATILTTVERLGYRISDR